MGAGPLPVSDHGLFPAEHRALRELYALARQLGGHWARLEEQARRPARGARPRRRGVEGAAGGAGRAHGRLRPARRARRRPAPASGSRGVRGASDLFLERNQAAARRGARRPARDHAARLSSPRWPTSAATTSRSPTWHRGWEARLLKIEADIRAAAVAEAERPRRGRSRRTTSSKLGRAGHSDRGRARHARRGLDARAAPPQGARSPPQPDVDLLELRRGGHQLPAAGRQRVHLAVLAQEHEVPVVRGGKRRRRSAASRRSRRGARSPGGRRGGARRGRAARGRSAASATSSTL